MTWQTRIVIAVCVIAFLVGLFDLVPMSVWE